MMLNTTFRAMMGLRHIEIHGLITNGVNPEAKVRCHAVGKSQSCQAPLLIHYDISKLEDEADLNKRKDGINDIESKARRNKTFFVIITITIIENENHTCYVQSHTYQMTKAEESSPTFSFIQNTQNLSTLSNTYKYNILVIF